MPMRPSIIRSPALLALLGIAALATVSACHDTAAPRRGVNVTVAATANRGPYLGTDTAGRPRITCEVDFVATAVGVGSARWHGAMYNFYYGKTRTTPDAVYPMSVTDISQGWSADSIAAGAGEHSTWDFYGGIPFDGEFDFQYDDGVDTTTHHAPVRFTCGPAVSPNTPPPLIDTLMMVPPSGILPSGAPLTVSYGASSDVGIWETMVQVTGPCVFQKVFFEQLHDSASHEISVPMPTTCMHDVPIYLDVAVVDAAAQGVQTIISSPVVIEDRLSFGGGPLLLPSRAADLRALGVEQLEPRAVRLPLHFGDARPDRPRAAREQR